MCSLIRYNSNTMFIFSLVKQSSGIFQDYNFMECTVVYKRRNLKDYSEKLQTHLSPHLNESSLPVYQNPVLFKQLSDCFIYSAHVPVLGNEFSINYQNKRTAQE